MDIVARIIGVFFMTFILSFILGAFYCAGVDVSLWEDGIKFFVVASTFSATIGTGLFSVMK